MLPQVNRLNLLVSHQDQVIELPKNATCLAFNDFCQNAAFIVDNHVLCFQAHPEFIESYAKALLDARKELLGNLIYSSAVKSLSNEQDGLIVAEWMINFIKQANHKK